MATLPELDSLILVILTGFVCLLPFLYPRKKALDIFSPIVLFCVFYGLLFFVRPLYLLLYDPTRVEDWRAFNLALIYATVGCLCFYTGYFSRIGRAIGHHLISGTAKWNQAKLVAVIMLFSAISSLAFIILEFFILRLGVWYHLTHLLEVTFNYLMSGTLPIIWGLSFARTAFWLLFTFWLSQGASWGLWRKLFLVFYLAISLIFTSLAGLRWPILQFFMVPAVVFHYLAKRISILKAIVLVMVLAIGLGELEFFRSTGVVVDPVTRLPILLQKFIVSFLSFENFVQVVRFIPAQVDFLYGRPYLYLTLAFIPRVIWPDKPIFTDQLLTSAILPAGPELNTFTVLGDFYANFYIVGIILGMFLWGILWRAIYSYLLRNQHNPSAVVIYAATITMGIPTIRSNIIEFIFFMAMYILPLVLAIHYINVKQQRIKAALKNEFSSRRHVPASARQPV